MESAIERSNAGSGRKRAMEATVVSDPGAIIEATAVEDFESTCVERPCEKSETVGGQSR